MKSLRTEELRGKSIEELHSLVAEERAGLYKARRDLAFRQLTDFKSLNVRRHNIARLLTLITEKERGIEPAAAKAKPATAEKPKAAKKAPAKKGTSK